MLCAVNFVLFMPFPSLPMLGVPIPEEAAAEAEKVEDAIHKALREAQEQRVSQGAGAGEEGGGKKGVEGVEGG
eukprot:763564-Hanusia_phi.AAC.3